jgi:hypothetical protein
MGALGAKTSMFHSRGMPITYKNVVASSANLNPAVGKQFLHAIPPTPNMSTNGNEVKVPEATGSAPPELDEHQKVSAQKVMTPLRANVMRRRPLISNMLVNKNANRAQLLSGAESGLPNTTPGKKDNDSTKIATGTTDPKVDTTSKTTPSVQVVTKQVISPSAVPKGTGPIISPKQNIPLSNVIKTLHVPNVSDQQIIETFKTHGISNE